MIDARGLSKPDAHRAPDNLRWGGSGFWTTVAVLLLVASCSPQAKHGVLTFFFDGVPPLGGVHVVPDAGLSADAAVSTAPDIPRPIKGRKKFYNHPAYFENRCEGCHDLAGGLLKSVREGLCQSCHPEKPAKKKFVHGPMAVNACLACHRYHKSLYPKVLVADAQDLCFHCHDNSELRTDEHHKTIETERCIECHDAHGGDDRFFLIKKPEPDESS